MKTIDTKTTDPGLERLMRQKAESTPAIELVEEIETLHAGLHDMKAQNFALVRCLAAVKVQAFEIIAAEAKAAPAVYDLSEPLAKVASRIIKALARVKGIL